MSEEKKPTPDLAEMTLAQLEDTLFRDSTIEVTDHTSSHDPMEAMKALMDSGAAETADQAVEAQEAAKEEVEVPAPEEAPVAPESAAAQQQASPEMQQYLSQNQQILDYLAQQQQTQQASVEQGASSDEAINEAIRAAGLDPREPMHQFAYRQSMESSSLEQRLIEMEQRVQHYEREAATANAQAHVSPQVSETLKPYGDLPQDTIDTIRDNAALAMSHGYDVQQSIDLAVKPYLGLLRHMKTLQGPVKPAPEKNTPLNQPTRDDTGLLAASLTGRSTGHGKQIENLSIDDIEKVLFK